MKAAHQQARVRHGSVWSSYAHPSADSLGNSLGTSTGIGLDLMLPEPNHDPSESSKSREVEFVASSIVLNFRAPVWTELVAPPREMPTVPKVTVYEHGHVTPRKYEVGATGQRALMNSKPKPLVVHESTNQ